MPIVVECDSVNALVVSTWVLMLLNAISKVWFWLLSIILVDLIVLVLVSLLNPVTKEL